MKSHVVELVEAPHHHMQWIKAQSTNIGLGNEIMPTKTFWFGHLLTSSTANPALSIANEVFIAPDHLGKKIIIF